MSDQTADRDAIFGGQNRREVLKKIGVGAAAWTVPTILSVKAVAAASGPCCGEKMLNGSFESGTGGTPDSWTVTGSAGRAEYSGYTGVITPPAGGGLYSGYASVGGGELSQTASLAPSCAGNTYLLSCQAFAPFTTAGTITLTFTGASSPAPITVPASPGPPPFSYSAYTLGGTIPSGATAVTVAFTASGGSAYVAMDLVSFMVC